MTAPYLDFLWLLKKRYFLDIQHPIFPTRIMYYPQPVYRYTYAYIYIHSYIYTCMFMYIYIQVYSIHKNSTHTVYIHIHVYLYTYVYIRTGIFLNSNRAPFGSTISFRTFPFPPAPSRWWCLVKQNIQYR
jgi:hypothetical protein